MAINDKLLELNERILDLYTDTRTFLEGLKGQRLLQSRQFDLLKQIDVKIGSIQSQEVELFIAGPQRVGKTTLLSVIAGRDPSMPLGIAESGAPVTAVLQVFRHRPGDEEVRVHFLNPSQPLEVFDPRFNRDRVRDFTTVGGARVQDVDYVEFFSDDPTLRGLCLIDAPGFDDVQDCRADIARKWAPTAHGLVLVISAQSTFSSGDLEFLRDFKQSAGTSADWEDTFFVMNRIDELLIPEEGDDLDWTAVESVRDRWRQALENEFGGRGTYDCRIFPLQANLAHRDFSWVQLSRKYRVLEADEFEAIQQRFKDFYEKMREHIEGPDAQRRYCRKPVRELAANLSDLSLYLEQLFEDCRLDTERLGDRIEQYTVMARRIEEQARTIWDRYEEQMLDLEAALKRTWDIRTDSIAERVADDLAGQLERVLEECREEVAGRADAVQEKYVSRVAEPSIRRIQREIFSELVDPTMEQLNGTLRQLVRDLQQEATELLRSKEFGGVFAGMSFARGGGHEEVIVRILGAFAHVVDKESDLYERISRRGETAAAGGGVGALIGGILGGLLGGPGGAVLGVAIGGGAGAGVGYGAGEDGLRLRANWPREAAKQARGAIKRTLKKQFLENKSRLVDVPFSSALDSIRQECLAPVQRQARNHLESLRASLYDLRDQRDNAQARRDLLTPHLDLLRTLGDRVQVLAEELDVDIAAG